MALYENCLPKSWQEVVGQDDAVRKLLKLRDRNGGFGGEVFYITGSSGTGKTTIGRLIAQEVAGEIATIEMGGPKCSAEFLEKIERWTTGRAMDGRGWAIIINEVQSFSRAQVDRLLDILEHVPPHVVWIFTTTNTGSDRLFEVDEAPAFLSRAKCVSLAQRGLCDAFAVRLVAICRGAGLLNGKPDEYYLARATRLLKELRNNFRAALQKAEDGYLTDGDEHGKAA